MNFNIGDVCICSYPIRTNKPPKYHKDCRMRIISFGKNGVSYRVWNIDLERYETIGETFLSLCPQEIRDRKLTQLLDESSC